MSPEKRTTAVHILGQEYRVRSQEDGDFVRDVAQHVDDLMKRIAGKMSSGTKTQIAVLAALNIAEELFRLQRGEGQGDHDETQRVRRMVHRMADATEDSPKPHPKRAGQARGRRAKSTARAGKGS